MNPTRTAATQLINAGIVPLPLYDGTKKPIGEGWQNSKMPTIAQLADLFPDNDPRNIGALMGASSGYAQGIDFDLYAAFSRWKGEYKPPETRTIFTPRGLRTIYRTEPEALATCQMKMDGTRIGEFLADGAQMVMPPSRLKDGYEYTDNRLDIAYMPPDHPAFLALVKLTEKPYSEQIAAEIAHGKRRPARFALAALNGRIPTGKRYPTRSELDAAIIQSLARSGFDAIEIYGLLDSANLRSRWHERKETSRHAEIARVIAKFADTNSPASLEALKRADALAEYRKEAAWPRTFDTGKTRIVKTTGEIKPLRVTQRTVEAVLLAHETKIRDCLTHTYQLDTRAGDGRFANIERRPFELATKILLKEGVIRRVKAAKGTCAHVYEVPTEATLFKIFKAQASLWQTRIQDEIDDLSQALASAIDNEHTTNTKETATRFRNRQKALQKKVTAGKLRIEKLGKRIAVGHFNTVSARQSQGGVEVAYTDSFSAGVFAYSGLGQTAFRIYRAALEKPLTTLEISALTGLHIRTVQLALKKLVGFGLVEKCPGRCWQSDAVVNWQAVGDYLNTTTGVQAKQQQTRARREARENSYKQHSPQQAMHKAEILADASLADATNRAVVKAANNVNRYGAKWETLEPARQRADLIDLEKQQYQANST